MVDSSDKKYENEINTLINQNTIKFFKVSHQPHYKEILELKNEWNK